MSTTYPDARTWAQEHSLANVPRLARLEGFAFQRHPEIVASFGADGAAMADLAARQRRSGARTAMNWAAGLIGTAVLVAPVVGVAVYAAGPGFNYVGNIAIYSTAGPIDARIAVPIAGICFVLAALGQLALWVMWLRGGARWAPGTLGVAAIAGALAAFAAAGMPVVSQRDGTGAGAWLIPVWATLALAAVLVLAILLRMRVRAPEPPADAAPPAPSVSDREHARMLVRDLDETERRAVQADRDDALRILSERGLIDDATLRRALAADLGTLFTLDPIRGA